MNEDRMKTKPARRATKLRRCLFLGTSICLAASVLVGFEDGAGPEETPAVQPLDVFSSGMTVTKVRTADHTIIVLEERLTSIFEDGPQRTLAMLRSDGQPLQSYIPPTRWSVADFAVHPSGEISV